MTVPAHLRLPKVAGMYAPAVLKLSLQAARQMQAAREPTVDYRDIVDWAEQHFLIAEEGTGQRQGHPIRMARHQAAILRHIFQPGPDGRVRYSTVVYSTTKKGGKTTISALAGRYVAETQGPFAEVYCVANDYDQARNRAFASIARSIELDPRYNTKRRSVPGQWQVQERSIIHQPSGGKIRALATDYKGEAGAEPTMTLWTELWGYVHEASLRFWTEMTPTPTRRFSMRWVETYAGFEGESTLLEALYDAGHKDGRQLTAGELGDPGCFEEAPNPDSLVPCFVNEAAGLFMYWDDGPQSHRMPWQKGPAGDRYYEEQAAVLLPSEYQRIHLNEWSSGEGEAIPTAWWDACEDPEIVTPPPNVPVVVAVDASVSGDCTAVAVVARHPSLPGHIVWWYTRIWVPPAGQKMDYTTTITPEVDLLIERHNVVEVAYDEYQLHHWATEQRAKPKTAWYRPFPQGQDRLIADKQLYDLIRDRRLHHTGDPEVRRHIQGCGVKIPKDEANKLRLVKRNSRSRIDAAICGSMAAAECLRLNL